MAARPGPARRFSSARLPPSRPGEQLREPFGPSLPAEDGGARGRGLRRPPIPRMRSRRHVTAFKMAAPRAILGGAPQAGGGLGGLLRLLGGRLREAAEATAWGQRLRRRRLRSLNRFCGFLRATHGEEVAAAIFTLSLGGAVRFEGQPHWLRPRGRWRHEVLRHRDVPVVALDLSGCPVTYQGLANLAGLRGLRSLDLSGCPHVDDWALGRLHVLGGTLRDLSVAHCPLVTERGLATLHHLRELRRLEATGLGVPNAGLVGILLEETLPHCRVLGLGGHPQDLGTPPGPSN